MKKENLIYTLRALGWVFSISAGFSAFLFVARSFHNPSLDINILIVVIAALGFPLAEYFWNRANLLERNDNGD